MEKKSFNDLAGKSCVITGGAGVIGTSIVTCLAQAGVKTAILDLDGKRAADKAKEIGDLTGGELTGICGDVLDRKSLQKAAEAVIGRWGRIDILINAAGGNSPKATTAAEMIRDEDIAHLETTFFGLESDAFRSVFDLNFMGTLLPAMVFGRDMVERKAGVILNISSMNSFRPLTRIPAYSAAKASVNNFTAWLAVHCARRNVRVNAIAPGFFLTEQNRFLLYDAAAGGLTVRGRKIIEATPMNRFGTPDELQGAVLYLISDLSKFVTGVVLPIDGGFSAYSGV